MKLGVSDKDKTKIQQNKGVGQRRRRGEAKTNKTKANKNETRLTRRPRLTGENRVKGGTNSQGRERDQNPLIHPTFGSVWHLYEGEVAVNGEIRTRQEKQRTKQPKPRLYCRQHFLTPTCTHPHHPINLITPIIALRSPPLPLPFLTVVWRH